MGTLIQLAVLSLTVGLVAPLKMLIPPNDSGSYSCSTECTDGITNGDVAFTQNDKYTYTFKGKTIITAPTGTLEGESEVLIFGIANIVGTKSCGAVLYLKHVKISHDSKTYTNTQLEGYPILFSYNNGQVGSIICSASKDSVTSMNLKRAILSALQVSSVQEDQRDFFETDIQGMCNTSYSSIPKDTTLEVTKIKDLTHCTKHAKIYLSGLTSTQSNMVFGDSPFSTAIQKTDIQIEDSTIKSAKSQETFIYQPFGPIGAKTEISVSMNLDFRKMVSINRLPSLILKKARSIVLEQPTSVVKSEISADDLVEATKLAMQNLEPVVEMDGAKYYADLVSLLKVAQKDDILNAFEQIKNGRLDSSEIAQNTFLDALRTANSGESIEAAAQLIDSNAMSDSQANSWLENLANAKYPTKESIALASNLLNKRGLKNNYMGVGYLIRNYIQETNDTNSYEIGSALSNLGAPLKNAFDASLSPDDEDRVIGSLKGIRNAMYITNDVADQIVQIILDKSVKQRIKAAALDVAKTYAENPKIEKACENIFTDKSEDSELRLLAFKTFACYPSNNKANVIQSVLDDKNCPFQIQSYLSSYLRNLQTTSDGNKLKQKEFYRGIQLKSTNKSFDDIIRYSRNLEYSYQSIYLHNSKLFISGDVLYAYDSYLARSFSISTKALLFGRQYYIFDIDTRVQNIEYLLEQLFGPEGFFAEYKGNTLDAIKNYVNQAVAYGKNRQLNGVDSPTPGEEKNYENTSTEDLNQMYLDVAIKVLGYDLGWFSFQANKYQATYQYVINTILNKFNDVIPDKNNIEINIKKQISIFDYEKMYATCSGLPVSLKMQAASAIKMDLATNFDIESYIKHPEDSSFKFKFVPSGSLTLNTLLTVDGFTVEAGHKISSSLHTSTGFDFSGETLKGRGFEIIYKLPLDVMDVLSAKSEAFTIVREKGNSLIETPLVNPDITRQTYSRTFDNLKNSIGLSFSGQYDFPWTGELKSLLPFTGPLSFSLKVSKEDKNLNKYAIRGTYDFNKLSSVNYVKLIYITPGADISRGVELVLAHENQENGKFTMKYKTPSSEIALQCVLVNSDLKKTIEVKYANGCEHIFKIGLEGETVDEYTIKYTPILKAMYAEQIKGEMEKNPYVPNMDIEGYITVKQNVDTQKFIAKRSLDYPNENFIKPKTFLYDIAAVTNNGKHLLNGSLILRNKDIEAQNSLYINEVNFNHYGYLSGDYPAYKLVSKLDVTKDEQSTPDLPSGNSDDEYRPESKFVNQLYKIKTLKIATDQELHVESPYVFKSANQIVWDKNDYMELNGDVLVENDELTMYGNISTTDLFDLSLNANITVLPSTPDSGQFIRGDLEHYLISDTSNGGHVYFKYVQDKNKKGGQFDLVSRCPMYSGVFDLSTQHRLTDEGCKCVLKYDANDNTILNIGMSTLTNDIKFDADFKSPNPEYTSSVNFHGWSKNNNMYLFDTKLVWPSTSESNYLNANGQLFLNGRQCDMSGNLDFPSAKLKNVQVSLNNIPNTESENEGILTARCFSKDQVYLSEKFKYKLNLDNGEVYFSGENIPEDSSKILPMKVNVHFINYTDSALNTGKELNYNFELEYNGQTYTYDRLMQITNGIVFYKQLHKIDDNEQTIEMDLKYNVIDAQNWSYHLKSKITSSEFFHYFLHDNQNLLEFNSATKLTNSLCDQRHYLNIYSSDVLNDSYELRFFLDKKKTAIKIKFGEREIRNLAHYSLQPMDGGHKLSFSGQFWSDYLRDKSAKSTLGLDSYYSLENGLSSETNLKIYIPPFQDKDITINHNIQMFKNRENLLDTELNLDVFSSPRQAIKLQSSLKRSLKDNGVLYSAKLKAKSDEMKLDYSVKNSVLLSNESWKSYLDASYVDSESIIRPIQLYFEYVPDNFNGKINVFNISVVNVHSTVKVKDGVLNTLLNIDYNDNPYTLNLLLNSNASFNFGLGWNDKTGSQERLEFEGSFTRDDSAVMSASRVLDNGNVIPIGSIKKSLQRSDWWDTDKHLSSKELNLIWQSLKGRLIAQFVGVNKNVKSIVSMAKDQRNLLVDNARKSKPLFRDLKKYTNDECMQIWDEVCDDEYIQKTPNLILNTTEILLANFIQNLKPMDISFEDLNGIGEDVKFYSEKLYDYYVQNINNALEQSAPYFDSLGQDAHLAKVDLQNILDMYTKKLIMDMLTDDSPAGKAYYNYTVNNIENKIAELKEKFNSLRDTTADYINQKIPSNTFRDTIEKLKSYPYNEKVWNEIHKNLQQLMYTAPTKDYASFVNALDGTLDKVLHDEHVTDNDIINLRNKGIIVAKSLLVDLSDYVDYDTADSFFNAVNKLAAAGQNVLNVMSPGVFSNSSAAPNLILDLSQYAETYYKYLSPSNLLPPFRCQGVIINSINMITFNGNYYSFKPNTASYILAKDNKNNKFSILANYDNNVLISISMLTDQNETYLLRSGGTATVNGDSVSFPFTNDKVRMTKDLYFFEMDAAIGLIIKCNIQFDMVTLFINGYYYGKVSGLLGTMNQEPTFDYKLPNGQISEDLKSFLKAYRVSGNTKPIVNDLVSTDQFPCPSLFSEVSSLKSCFSAMTPTAYRSICNQMVSTKSEQDSVDTACLVAKTYVSMARDNYATDCNLPDMCITSTVNDQLLGPSSSIEISEKSDAADIIILFSETADNQNVFSVLLKPFMEYTINNFKANGIDNVNFVTIGYSGKPGDSEVHIYPVNMDDHGDILDKIPQWSEINVDKQTGLASQFVESYKTLIGKNSKDKAYKLSGEYPFRPNAVKAVVAITQTVYTTDNPLDISQFTFDFITSCFVEQGIKFYLVAPINLQDSSNQDIIGTNGIDSVYTLGYPKGTSSSRFTYDKSLETGLVVKTNGNMFDSQKFVAEQDYDKKIFTKALSKTITKQAVKDSTVTKTCTTSVHDGIMPYAKCFVAPSN